jgi:MoxR-like ATPase
LDEQLRDRVDEVQEAANILKASFVGKDELIEMLVTCAIAHEHLLIVGPPGTGKSELVRRFALLCSPAAGAASTADRDPYFEYLFTRFTEPNEIFGPVDLKGFQEGRYGRVTKGMLPHAEFAFLDEIFKANSAILNALLSLLNERLFFNGGRSVKVPLLCAVGATNEVPEDPSLAAIYDRFLLRVWSDNVDEVMFDQLLQLGWKLEQDRIRDDFQIRLENVTSTEAFRALYRALSGVRLDGVTKEFREAVRRIRAEGIDLSDRRVIKLLKLVAASALRRKSLDATTGDFWVLQHAWNNPDQIPNLRAVIEPYLAGQEESRWVAELDVQAVRGHIAELEGRQASIRTDADFADFLRDAQRLRLGLEQAARRVQDARPLLNQLMALIDRVMSRTVETD